MIITFLPWFHLPVLVHPVLPDVDQDFALEVSNADVSHLSDLWEGGESDPLQNVLLVPFYGMSGQLLGGNTLSPHVPAALLPLLRCRCQMEVG